MTGGSGSPLIFGTAISIFNSQNEISTPLLPGLDIGTGPVARRVF